MTTAIRLVGASLVLSVLAACSSPAAASPVSEPAAREMAEHMLAAYNAGDYEAWSRDWSQQMKDAIGAEAFTGFRDQTMQVAGPFEAIESVKSRPGNNPGVWRWEFTARFENGTYVFMIAFNEGGPMIEGVNLEPAA